MIDHAPAGVADGDNGLRGRVLGHRFPARHGSLPVADLIIHGDADATVPIDTAGRAAARMIPNTEYRDYPGAPHGFLFTHKNDLNAGLMAFAGS